MSAVLGSLRMMHHSTGLHRILEYPRVYEGFQRLLGAHRARQRLVREFLRPFAGARILDIGCGPGSLLDDLPDDVEYVGYDLNPIYIESARRRYGDRARFFCERVGREGEAAAEGGFDFVVAKSILHHLSDDEAHGLLATARRALMPGGVFFSADATRHEGQAVVAKVLAALDRGRNVRTPETYRQLILPYFPEIEASLVTDLLRVPYSHFIVRAGAVSHTSFEAPLQAAKEESLPVPAHPPDSKVAHAHVGSGLSGDRT